MTTQSIKTGFAVAGVMMTLIAGLLAIISVSIWIEFVTTDARNAEACRTAWDSRYQPQYVASQCSILQRGYRVPTPSSRFLSLNEIRSPDAGDY